MSVSNRPFLFLDGEGGDNPDGSHSYMVLCGWSEYTGPLMLRNDDGTALSTVQILDWLLELATRLVIEETPHTFIGFGLGYDVAMILKDLPERVAKRYYMPERMNWLTDKGMARWASWGPYLFKHMGSQFQLCESTVGVGARVPEGEKRKYVEIWDIFKFFQGSFVQALTKWEIIDQQALDAMEAMKRRRGGFRSDNIDDEVIAYCLSECEAGVRLMERLNETCLELGYPLARLDGAGSLAAAMLKQWNVAQYMADVPVKMRHAVSCAYSGGWFERAYIGRYTSPVYQNDINSAYPHVIQNLPCLAHADWKASTHVEQYGLYEVEFKYPDPCRWGALPFRNRKGEITHPTHGIGWYWGSEILAAERLYPGSHNIRQGWTLKRDCNHVPFAQVPAVYMQRLQLGASAKGIVLKLGLNSLYGKTAQSVGQPKYANYIWAGMITAGCRAMILDAIAKVGPENVMGVATDAIYTTVPAGLPGGREKTLGDWDETISPNGDLSIQPGISINYDAEHVATYKSRGMGKAVFAGHARAAEIQWQTLGILGSFRASSHRFMGTKAALARNNYDIRCRWLDVSAALRFYPGVKRKVPSEQLLAHLTPAPVVTLAPDGVDYPSYPYKHIYRRLTEGYHEGGFMDEQPSPDCELLELTTIYG